MRISINSITDSIKKKAFINFLKDFRSARALCTQNINVYDLFEKVQSPQCNNSKEYNFLISLMSNLEVQSLNTNYFSTTQLQNGVIIATVLNQPINNIYKKFYEREYISAILEKNLNCDVYIK